MHSPRTLARVGYGGPGKDARVLRRRLTANVVHTKVDVAVYA